MTASTPPGRSTRSHAAYSTPPPGPPRPVMARAACPASGQPASSSRAGPPARTCASGRRAGSRSRSRRASGRVAGGRAGEQAQDPASGCGGCGQERPGPGGGDDDQLARPGERRDDMRGFRAGTRRPGRGRRAGQTLTARRSPGRSRPCRAADRRYLQGRARRAVRALGPREVLGVTWAAGPAATADPLTLRKSGFRDLFHAPPRNSQAAGNGVAAAGIPPGPEKPGLPDGRGRGYHSPCTSRVPAVYLRTWPRNSRPAANVTPPRRACPAPGRDRDAALRGQVTARSTAGQCQVDGRSAGGRPGVRRRSTPGQWRLAAWASAPIRYP